MKSEYTDTTVKEARLLTKPAPYAENGYEIDIRVPEEHQHEGAGTRLLKQVTDDADNEGVTLYAKPEPKLPGYDEEGRKRYEKDKNRLIGLYRRFGFEFEGYWSKWTGIMIRKQKIRK
ncbi:Acetyltransferase (GNAT) family protein [uncultured archaeon]|nr:Acetyltransferase (GNAT) family protein [uncultured archaeon]